MGLFNPKYVHAMWSSEIEGKEVIVSDRIDVLKEKIDVLKENLEKGCSIYATITRSIDGGIGLHTTEGVDWNYAYYDPNLNVKIAFMEGKRIGYSMNHVCSDPPDEVLHKDTPGNEERLLHVLDCLNPMSTVILDTEPYTKEVLKWTDLKIGSIIRSKVKRTLVCAVIAIDYAENTHDHIFARTTWLSDKELAKNWELLNDN